MLQPSSSRSARTLLSNVRVTQYQAPFWTTHESVSRNSLPSVLLPIHDCHKIKDETRYVEDMIWAQARYFSPENRTDRSDPGSRMRKRKAHHHIQGQFLCFYYLTYRERWLSTAGVKDIKNKQTKNLGSPKGCLVPLTNPHS